MSDIDTDTDGSVAEQLSDAVEAVEEATVETFRAAVECGDVDAAERLAASVVEDMRRAVADVEAAADTVEQVAEEIAEDASPEVEEVAEAAVDAAHEAQNAVDEAAAEVRDEMREQGGGDVTEDTAVHQEIHEGAEEARESLPVESVPVVDAEESISHEIADIPDDPPPKLIAPQVDHPYYRKRSLKLFGRKFEI